MTKTPRLKKVQGKKGSSLLTALLVSAAVFFPAAAEAAQAVPEPGESLQHPKMEENGKLTVEDAEEKPAAGEEVRLVLSSVRIEHEGMKLKDEELSAIIDPLTGHEISAAELNAGITALTQYARNHGYPAALAYIPEQTATEGNLRVCFAPGRYGAIQIDSQDVLRRGISAGYLAGLREGDIIESDKLENALRNLMDIPGIKVDAALVPGSAQGTSDLRVRVLHGKRSSYVLYAENYGSEGTGRYRYGLQAEWRNIEGSGSRLNVGGMLSNGEQNAYNIGYEIPVGHSATTLGISYSHSSYELGSIWSQLGAEGKSDTFSLYGKTPLQHLARSSMNLLYGVNYRKLKDEMQGIDFGDRHSYSASLGLGGMVRGEKNVLQYNVSVHGGNVVTDSDFAEQFGAAAGDKGTFFKGTADLLGLQQLGGPFDVMLKVSGQKAANNLDSSEHIYLGGARGVRAYPQGEGSGDEGALGTLEFRYHTKLPGLIFSVYYDAGHIHTEKRSGGGQTLQGWGLGLTYSRPDDWFARVDYARRIGLDEGLSNDAQSRERFWFMVGKVF